MKAGNLNQVVRNQLIESKKFFYNEKCKKRPTILILNSITYK